MTSISSITCALAPRPLASLTPEDGYVLGIRHSGVTTTPYAIHAIRRTADGRVVDEQGDTIAGNHGAPIIAWMDLPFTPSEVQEAEDLGTHMAQEANIPTLEGPLEGHVEAVRALCKQPVAAVHHRAWLLRIHTRIGNDIDGPRLPEGTSEAHGMLAYVRAILSGWAHGRVTDQEARDEIRAYI